MEILKNSKGKIGQSIPTEEDIEIEDTRVVARKFEDLEVFGTGLFPSSIEEYNFIGKALGEWYGFVPKVGDLFCRC